MLIDTHTHLQFRQFDGDRQAVLDRAQAAGVERLVVIGTDLASSRAAVTLAAAHPDLIGAAVGIHPSEAASCNEATLAKLIDLAQSPQVVAWGECGLDYYRDRCPRKVQQAAFLRQQEVALELGLPLIIHSRESLDDCYRLLAEAGGFGTRVVMHCFTSMSEQLDRFVAQGCYIGTDGPVTFPKATDAHAIARRVPADRLLLETDCPFLAPVPHRGQRCEPAHVRLVAERVAELRGVDYATLIAQTGANALAFFAWDRP